MLTVAFTTGRAATTFTSMALSYAEICGSGSSAHGNELRMAVGPQSSTSSRGSDACPKAALLPLWREIMSTVTGAPCRRTYPS